jgi:hypothetical protein
LTSEVQLVPQGQVQEVLRVGVSHDGQLAIRGLAVSLRHGELSRVRDHEPVAVVAMGTQEAVT